MEEIGNWLRGGKKKEKPPTETPTKKLSGQEFTERVRRNIEKSEWAPQLSFQLTEITLAELEHRSPIKDNLPLYSQLAIKAGWLAVKHGNKDEQGIPGIYSASSHEAVNMAACLEIAMEANRRVHDFLVQESEKPSA